MRRTVRPFVFGIGAFVAVCGLALGIGVLQAGGPPGEIAPPAPTVAEWAASPVDAPFTYQVTEIKIGDPRTDRILDARPAAINNTGQVVGTMERVPAYVPFWWRRVFGLPIISQFAPRPPFGQTAFVWDAAAGRIRSLRLPSGALASRAFDINDRGQIVGETELPPQNPRTSVTDAHAALWKDAAASPQDIGAALAPLKSRAYGINRSGQVRVRASGMAPNPRGIGGMHFVQPIYLWEKNTLKPTGADGWAFRLNDAGESIVSTSHAVSNFTTPETLFRIAPNKPVDPLIELNKKLRDPDTFASTNLGNRGQIAGRDADGPFVYSHGKLTRFFPRVAPPTPRATVQAMNRSNDIIGYVPHSPNAPPWPGMKDFMQYLWRNNRLRNVNHLFGKTPQWTVTAVYAINDRGQIVGFGQPTDPARRIKQPSGSLYEHVVLLTPVLPTRP